MKKFIIISIISCLALIENGLAQNADDAMLFSRHYAGGTARSMGMSGAFGALGGDPSVLCTNPAGLAVYRGSEFTVTPTLNFNSTNAEYDKNTFSDNNVRFNLNNIGYVYTKNTYNQKGLQSITFGFAYNRLSDFNSDAYIKRNAATSSMLDEFIFNANYGYDDSGIPLSESQFDDFYERLAWETYAMDWDEDNKQYFSDYSDFGYGQPLSRSISTRGGIGEYSFSLGSNFDNKLFLGATLGIQDVNYKEYYLHEETPEFQYMSSFKFNDEYSVNGWGVAFRAGVIYRPIQELRVGASIHTPVILMMSPEHLTSIDTYFNSSPPGSDGGTYFYSEYYDVYKRYNITTPWRYGFSAATVIGRLGVVDADVEIVDYSTCKISPKSNYDFENSEVAKIFKTAVNLKVGAEARLGPLYLRGGMAYYGNPYNKDKFDDEIKETLKNTISFSGGAGFRNRDFYMDAAYSFMKHPERTKNLYMSYDNFGTFYENTNLRSKSGKLIVTFGFRF